MSKKIYNLGVFVKNKEVQKIKKELEIINVSPYEDLNDDLKRYFNENIMYHFITKSLKPYKRVLSEDELLKIDKMHTKQMSVFSGRLPLSQNILYPRDYEEWFVVLGEKNNSKIKYIEIDEIYNNFKNIYYKDIFEKNEKLNMEYIWNYFGIKSWGEYLINRNGEKTNFEKIKNIDFEMLERYNSYETIPYIPININAAIIDGNWVDYSDKNFGKTIEDYLEKYRDTHTIIITTCYMVSQKKLKKMFE